MSITSNVIPAKAGIHTVVMLSRKEAERRNRLSSSVSGCVAFASAWIPAFAGMTVKQCG